MRCKLSILPLATYSFPFLFTFDLSYSLSLSHDFHVPSLCPSFSLQAAVSTSRDATTAPASGDVTAVQTRGDAVAANLDDRHHQK